MKRWGFLVVALMGPQLGCTAPQATPTEDLEVADPGVAARNVPALPGARPPLQPPPQELPEPPEVEPAPPSPQPHVAVLTDLPESGDEGTCPVWIEATGFPAIAADGSTIVLDNFEVDDASTDDMDGVRSIDWTDTKTGDTSRSDTLTDGSTYYREADDHPDVDPCIAYKVRAKLAARRINRALERHSWRPLQQLDVVLSDPYDRDEDEPNELRSIEASVRPVEMFWKAERLLARTPGVKVYLDVPAPWGNDDANYEPEEDEEYEPKENGPCDYEPVLESVYGDAASGVLMVGFGHDRARTSCLCPSYSYTRIVRAPPGLFERLDTLASRGIPEPVAG